jgi:asparagine synthase (glutamine-hydrolysing)
MCGIAGYIDFNKKTSEDIIGQMIKYLDHRGPDDKGFENHNSPYASIGLGQARLSIIDLTQGGHQPMYFNEYTIVYNGEVYNYQEIKSELKKAGHIFVSNSDTEVILHAFDQWGIDFVQKLIGMFVIAIYDSKKDKLFIFRDRAGVKPIYYYWNNGLFLFASELKSFFVHPEFKKEIDISALALYFDFGYVPAPYSIFQNTFKIEPGNYLILDFATKKISIETYWSILSFYERKKLDIGYDEAKSKIHELLISACNYRMVADVPVGVFLSSGYDSTAVTAILQKDRTEKLKTFTIGFEEGNNEAPFAKENAEYLGTDHTEYICTTREAQVIIPDLPFYYDEPFADSSAIPTILVSQIARKQVTVALSADAGDEIFAGYNRYIKLEKYLEKLNRIPDTLKSTVKPFINFLSVMVPLSKPDLKHKIKGVSVALNRNRHQQTAELFRLSNSLPDSYLGNLFIKTPDRYTTKYSGNFNLFTTERDIPLAVDYQMYLPNDILTKVDRATMAVSLEGREPLLDHRIVEFAAQLPIDYKYDGITTKRILKDIVHEYVPKEMMDRPKAGFSLPIYSWLNKDLGFLIDEFLNEQAIKSTGLFNTRFVQSQVSRFRNDKLHYKPFIWKLLMFQMWYTRWMK